MLTSIHQQLVGLSVMMTIFISLSPSQTNQLQISDHHSKQSPFINPISISPLSNQSSSTATSWRQDHHPVRTRNRFRIAIIGGGPAGTSLSYFLSQFANASAIDLEAHLFESSDYIGGRSTILHPFDSLDYPPVEAGASIFVDANKFLHRAIKQFNLSTIPFHNSNSQDPNSNFAIWDGTEFAYQTTGSTWWDFLKSFWRYGRAPFQLESLRKRIVDQFQEVYSDQFVAQGPFDRLDRWAVAAGLDHLLTTTGSEYLINEEAINVQAVNELVAIMARTNYGQDVSSLHGLATLVSMAGQDGKSVKGGNRQIFQHFLNHSRAQVHLNHRVTAITELPLEDENRGPRYVLSTHSPSPAHGTLVSNTKAFDAVVLAAPYHQAQITILSSEAPAQVPNQPFVKLHTTFVVTNATAPSGELFNRPAEELLPRSIYSTMMRNVLGKGQRPLFNSLNYLDNLGSKEGITGDMYIVKIFSEAPLSTPVLSKLFHSPDNLLWVKRLEWEAYPVLRPLADEAQLGPTKLGRHLYYVNGFESLISTMETQSLAAWNIAMSVSQDLWRFVPKQSWTTT